jgi:hypothetical protein
MPTRNRRKGRSDAVKRGSAVRAKPAKPAKSATRLPPSAPAFKDVLVGAIGALCRPPSVASRANRPIGDRMIMNAAFLVRRDKEVDFDGIVKTIGAKYDKLTFKYTGPWSPYNFVNIRLKLERA